MIKTKKRVLGEEHFDILTSMNNLAFTWKSQGRLAEVLDLMKDCAQIWQRVLRLFSALKRARLTVYVVDGLISSAFRTPRLLLTQDGFDNLGNSASENQC